MLINSVRGTHAVEGRNSSRFEWHQIGMESISSALLGFSSVSLGQRYHRYEVFSYPTPPSFGELEPVTMGNLLERCFVTCALGLAP